MRTCARGSSRRTWPCSSPTASGCCAGARSRWSPRPGWRWTTPPGADGWTCARPTGRRGASARRRCWRASRRGPAPRAGRGGTWSPGTAGGPSAPAPWPPGSFAMRTRASASNGEPAMSGPKAVPAIVVDLAKGHSLSEFYPVVHPTLVAALHRLEEALLAHGGDLHLDVAPGGLAAYGETVARRSPHVQRLAARLAEHGVRELVLRHQVTAESIGRLLSAVALPTRVVAAAGGLPAALSAAGVSKVEVNGGLIEPSRLQVS